MIFSPQVAVEEALAAAEYWTASAMQDAEPYPIPEIAEESQAQTQGTPGQSEGGLPVSTSEEEPPETEPQATQGGYNYPAPFNRFEVLDILYQRYPWCTIGKVFFTQNGNNYVASASSIGRAGKGVIWTAGHVVHAGDNKPSGWSTNMIFVPAYRDGNAPFGKWSVTSLGTRTVWYQKGNPNGLYEDMGAGRVAALNGKQLSQVVGWLGFAWNYSKFQLWNSMGYPAASPFNGQRMHDTEASYAYDGTVAGSPPPIGIGCDMTGGCSGGPWIMQFQTGNYVNGNNSYRRSTFPNEIYSPYFDSRAKSLFDSIGA